MMEINGSVGKFIGFLYMSGLFFYIFYVLLETVSVMLILSNSNLHPKVDPFHKNSFLVEVPHI